MFCFSCVCDEDEKELGRKVAPGACPSCGGKVQAIDTIVDGNGGGRNSIKGFKKKMLPGIEFVTPEFT
ncbi:hypothetical protein H5410_035442 [Solanum commersonii]|uniref:Uncharacterized protein n=1 Tax=Solanum commersonii TaxID=4109 RepID=A0A9J5Y2P1_SOLCO|nr:hypothetical protein H5410_035442 [Solanum commersonii]